MTDAQNRRPYVDPTLVDHHAPRAAPEPAPEAAAWQQSSNRPRPAGARSPRTRVIRESKRGYFARHWHGEMSLVRSYWVNNFLVATPLAFLLTGLMTWISVKGDSLQVSAISLLVTMPLLLALNLWCIVGAWRAAANYLRESGSALWGWLARITLALSTLQLLASVVFGFLPSVGEYWSMARGVDPLGQAKFSFSADGRSLRLDGVIGMGDGERLRQLLNSEAARDLKRVELASPGGRVREAERMAAALKARGQASRAVGTCASACTLVFLAGQPRHMTATGELGFHRASTGTYNPVFEELANQQLAKTYTELGLPQPMIDKTLRTPSRSMWFVPRDELVSYALIAPAPPTLAVPLPAANATLADFDDALHMHPVWEALDKRTPGTVDDIAKRMLAAHQAGASEEEVQATVLSPLARQMPDLLGGTDAVLRHRYVQLVSDQLKALRTPPAGVSAGACRDLLDGRMGVRPQLPQALQVREAQWLQDVANGTLPHRQPKPVSALEIEVLERTVGPTAMGMLSRLWVDAPEAAKPSVAASCDPAIAMLDRLQGQPPARRDLAERLLFQPSR
ncbi:hypothetical protein [Pelomonas sp. Root1237]|uniref:COG3904 family protein n=1 Tax=Pelomonas sp. Root1237 TaxID=1736434 RepID=UPI0006FE5271|nr:hypothetical protein [Pelomonas sp. Root1237]KQV86512.1 hypothetical protein ASC91_22020 [Pelomonas sp. Root1237]